MPAELTDQRIADYEERVRLLLLHLNGWHIDADFVNDLLSELRRCQARIAAVEALGRRLDPVDPKSIRAALTGDCGHPNHGEPDHAPFCAPFMACGGEGDE